MLLNFKGRWNAYNNTVVLINTSTPISNALVDGVGTLGDCYIIFAQSNTASFNIFNRDLGSGTKSWVALYYIYYDGSEWQLLGEGGGGSGMTNPMTELGDMIYGGASGTPTRLAGNDTTRLKFLSQVGNGIDSAQPQWQLLPITGSLVYYMLDSNSDIATYKNLDIDSLGSTTTFTTGSIGTGTTLLRTWATKVNVPNVTVLPSGLFVVHLYAAKTAGTKECVLYAELWEISSTGVDIGIIGTTTDTHNLIGTPTTYSLTFSTSTAYAMASAASRVAVKVYVLGASSGSQATVDLYYGSTTRDSSIYIPVGTVNVDSFVPYVGATNDVDLGANDITATKHITAGGTSSDFVKGDGTLDSNTYGPGGSNRQVQFNNSGSFDGSSKNTINSTDGYLDIASVTTVPSAPSAGVKLYSINRTGIDDLSVIPLVGNATTLQRYLGTRLWGYLGVGFNSAGNFFVTNGIYQALPASNTTQGFTILGTGAVIGKSYDATNLLPNYDITRFTTAAAINSSAGIYGSYVKLASMFNGSGAIGGGTKITFTFAFTTYASTQRIFVGIASTGGSAISATTDPSTVVNSIALIKDVADTTLHISYTANSAINNTKVNTAITPSTNNLYRLTIFVPPLSNTANYVTLEEITKSSITVFNSSNTNATRFPLAGSRLYPFIWANTGSGTSAVAIALISVFEEQFQ
jgi:hypothetical protein